MLSRFAKGLFVATSLAPVLAAFAVEDLAKGHSWLSTAPLWAGFILLPVICLLLMCFARRSLERQTMAVTKIKSTDKEVLAYLVAYLLPLLAKDAIDYRANFAISAFVLGMIFLTVLHGDSFHFNPILAMFGYHFYEIEADKGMTYLLISPNVMRTQSMTTEVVPLFNYVYLEVGQR